MNALALKQRLRDRLRNRKFELENIAHSYRNTVNYAKLEANTKQHVKRKEPGIQTLARKYNTLCKELADMIQSKKAPRGAIAPLPIVMDTLFNLDVDDNIWQDFGLTDDNDDGMEIPLWLGEEWVKKGIKSLLEIDRSMEERHRLISECTSMQQWMREEWVIVTNALAYSIDDLDVTYQLNKRRDTLLRLCVAWDPAIRIIPFEQNSDSSWGPNLTELANARHFEYNESVYDQDVENIQESRNLDSDDDDAELDMDDDMDTMMMDDLDIDELAYEFSENLNYNT